jgi:hypothetical protein
VIFFTQQLDNKILKAGLSNKNFEYLGEFETEFENILGWQSGA